ncbi:MAG: hypothetical protein ABL925_16590 [Methylococcales bacterium]
MLTLNIKYEVLSDRLVTIQLPETVSVGRHDLLLVLEEKAVDENIGDTNVNKLNQFVGTVSAFNGVDGVEYQKKVRSEWN